MAVRVQSGGIIQGGGGALESPIAEKTETGRIVVKYNAAELFILFGALPIHQGIAAGTFLTAERMEETWRFHPGCDGESCRTRSNNKAARVQVTLRQGTWVNDALSGVALSDEISGLIAVPLVIRDGNGRTLHSGAYSFITKPVPISYSEVEGANTWAFICDPWIPFTGGFDRLQRTSEELVGLVDVLTTIPGPPQ